MPGNFPDPPASVIASWPVPNYIDPPTLTFLTPFSVVLTALSSILVCIRFYLRTRKEAGGLGLDDALLLPGWLLAIVFTGLIIWSSKGHFTGRHIWDTNPAVFEMEALNAWVSELIFVIGTCCLKLSALFFFRRIQSGTYNRKWMFAIWAAIGFTVAYSLALVLGLIFNCNPTEAYWRSLDPTWQKQYACTNTMSLNVLAPCLSVVSDIYSVCLPCLMLQQLELPRRQRISLNAVFGVSFIIAAAGCGRIYSFSRTLVSYDLPWVGYWIFFWSILEYQLGIICACLPNLRVFIKQYIGTYISRSRATRSRLGSDAELTSMNAADGYLSGASHPTSEQTFDKTSSLTTTEVESKHYRPGTPPLPPTVAKTAASRPSSKGGARRIRTPREYEDFVMEMMEKSRKSLVLGSLRPRANLDKNLPPVPVPPSPQAIEKGFTALPVMPVSRYAVR